MYIFLSPSFLSSFSTSNRQNFHSASSLEREIIKMHYPLVLLLFLATLATPTPFQPRKPEAAKCAEIRPYSSCITSHNLGPGPEIQCPEKLDPVNGCAEDVPWAKTECMSFHLSIVHFLFSLKICGFDEEVGDCVCLLITGL